MMHTMRAPYNITRNKMQTNHSDWHLISVVLPFAHLVFEIPSRIELEASVTQMWEFISTILPIFFFESNICVTLMRDYKMNDSP